MTEINNKQKTGQYIERLLQLLNDCKPYVVASAMLRSGYSRPDRLLATIDALLATVDYEDFEITDKIFAQHEKIYTNPTTSPTTNA
jgi:hypothetical protein